MEAETGNAFLVTSLQFHGLHFHSLPRLTHGRIIFRWAERKMADTTVANNFLMYSWTLMGFSRRPHLPKRLPSENVYFNTRCSNLIWGKELDQLNSVREASFVPEVTYHFILNFSFLKKASNLFLDFVLLLYCCCYRRYCKFVSLVDKKMLVRWDFLCEIWVTAIFALYSFSSFSALSFAFIVIFDCGYQDVGLAVVSKRMMRLSNIYVRSTSLISRTCCLHFIRQPTGFSFITGEIATRWFFIFFAHSVFTYSNDFISRPIFSVIKTLSSEWSTSSSYCSVKIQLANAIWLFTFANDGIVMLKGWVGRVLRI